MIKCFLINGDICYISFRDMGYFQNMGYWDPHPSSASYWAAEGNISRVINTSDTTNLLIDNNYYMSMGTFEQYDHIPNIVSL